MLVWWSKWRRRLQQGNRRKLRLPKVACGRRRDKNCTCCCRRRRRQISTSGNETAAGNVPAGNFLFPNLSVRSVVAFSTSLAANRCRGTPYGNQTYYSSMRSFRSVSMACTPPQPPNENLAFALLGVRPALRVLSSVCCRTTWNGHRRRSVEYKITSKFAVVLFGQRHDRRFSSIALPSRIICRLVQSSTAPFPIIDVVDVIIGRCCRIIIIIIMIIIRSR